MARLNYLELPVGDRARAKAFYAEAFGWTFADYGPDYAATTSGDTDVGLDAAPDRVAAPLPVIEVDDLEAGPSRGRGGGRARYRADLRLSGRPALSPRRPGRTCAGGDAAGGDRRAGRLRSAACLGQLLEHHVALQAADMVDEEHPVQMVDLMLHAGGEQAGQLFLMRGAGFVLPADTARCRALHIGILFGDRQAAFVIGARLVADRQDFGIDIGLGRLDRLVVLVLFLLQVDDENALVRRRPGSRRGRCRAQRTSCRSCPARRARVSSVIDSTGLEIRRRRGSGISTMGRTAIARS